MTLLIFAIVILLMVFGVPLAAICGIAALACLSLFTYIPPQAVFQQLYQGAEYDLLQAVVFFIAAGSVMTHGSLASRLVKIGQALVGGLTGGLAITSVLICMFFAAVSGSSPATVVAIGTIMIPALTRNGYEESFSTGLLTSAGSLGILIPPSIPMIVWAVVMGVSVTKQFIAGIIPGLLLGAVLMAYSYFMAQKYGWHSDERFSATELWIALKEGVFSLFMPVLVLGGIYSGMFTATEAASVAFAYALLVELGIYRSINPADLLPILRESVLTATMMLFIIANASVLSYYFSVDQIPLRVAEFLLQYIDNKYLFLLLVNASLLIMGCFMDIVSALLVLGPVFLPLLEKFGIDPIHFGTIMVLNIEVAFLTPPFGINLFVASGITGKGIVDVSKSMIPYLLLIWGVLLVVTYFPCLSLWLPGFIQ